MRRPGVDIGADGERAVAGSGDDHHANVGIAIDLGQDSLQIGEHVRADRIQLGRAVQRQRRDPSSHRQRDAPFDGGSPVVTARPRAEVARSARARP